jgi:general secretion pathway protein E
VLTDLPPMSLSDSEMMIQFAKSIGGMNVDDYRRPQKGKIAVDLAGGPTEVVLASAGTTGGQRLQLRVRSEMIQTRLAELGMSAEVLQSVRAMCKKPGLILVSGRSDSGVTSTLYSLLREHDCFMQQIITFEKAPAIELENITQNRYDADEKLAPALVTALRRDPDVLMVDVCNDPASAGVLVEASNKKALLLGISAGDTFTALAKWIKTRGEAGPALKNLHGVLCQTLVRKLCPSCREPYKPDPQMLTKANLPTDKIDTFYRTPSRQKVDEKGRPIICQTCRGTGYFGRSAIFELLEVTDEVRQLAASGASLATIKASCRKNRMLYLQEQGLAKVISGTTSIQEVIRACASGKKS